MDLYINNNINHKYCIKINYFRKNTWGTNSKTYLKINIRSLKAISSTYWLTQLININYLLFPSLYICIQNKNNTQMVLLFRKYPLKKKQFKFTFNFGFKIYAKLLLQEYFHFSINLKFFFLTNKQLSNECSSSQSICQQKYFLFLTLSLLFFSI